MCELLVLGGTNCSFTRLWVVLVLPQPCGIYQSSGSLSTRLNLTTLPNEDVVISKSSVVNDTRI